MGDFPIAKYFVNSRGNKQLIDPENYVYRHNKGKRDVPGVRTYWTCDQYTICDAMATVLDDKIVKMPSHNHGSDLAGLEAKLQSLEAVARAKENPQIKPRQILAELSLQSNSLLTKLARRPEASLTRSIQLARAKIRDEPPSPATFADLLSMEIPEKYSKTKSGEMFLITKDYISEDSEKGILMYVFCLKLFFDSVYLF